MSKETKARIIRQNEKARVVDMATKRALDVSSHTAPEAFAQFCRDLLGVNKTHGLTDNEMHQLVSELNLPPTAFFNPGNHWTLVLNPGKETMRIYDPMSGVGDVSTDTRRHIHYSMGEGLMRLSKDGFWNFGRLLDDNYSLPDEPLQKLGAIQTDPWNCGPLAVYAAKIAHGNSIVQDR